VPHQHCRLRSRAVASAVLHQPGAARWASSSAESNLRWPILRWSILPRVYPWPNGWEGKGGPLGFWWPLREGGPTLSLGLWGHMAFSLAPPQPPVYAATTIGRSLHLGPSIKRTRRQQRFDYISARPCPISTAGSAAEPLLPLFSINQAPPGGPAPPQSLTYVGLSYVGKGGCRRRERRKRGWEGNEGRTAHLSLWYSPCIGGRQASDIAFSLAF
jgi:hypothetical protein